MGPEFFWIATDDQNVREEERIEENDNNDKNTKLLSKDH